MSNGKFIVIEGGDGSGKDTQVELLKEHLSTDTIFVRDPGSTKVGSNLREIVRYDDSLLWRAELFLFFAARAQLAEEIIIPNLEEGKNVISNRYDLSTIAYQVYGREQADDLDLILKMNTYARFMEPDLCIYLDIDPKLGLERAKIRGEIPNRFEEEELQFHQRVREGYLKHIEEYNNLIIDGTKAIEEIHGEMKKAINGIFG